MTGRQGVYLAGPINGCTDAEANGWRAYAAAELAPLHVLDPMARDYRGREAANVAAIVEGDKADIASCAVVLAYCPRPSFGTAMEILHAHALGIPVVAVVAGGPVSPWVAYHAAHVTPSLVEAVNTARGLACST